MKKFLAIIMLFTIAGELQAIHRKQFQNADDITSGTLAPERVDPTTFTLLGPSIDGSEIDDQSIEGKNIAFGTLFTSNTAAGAFMPDTAGVIFSTHLVGRPEGGYDVIIGTADEQGFKATVFNNTDVGWDSAMTICGTTGNTFEASPTCHVAIQSGIYTWDEVIIPRSVTLHVIGSSVVIHAVDNASTIMTVHGTIRGRLNVDLQDLIVSVVSVDIKTSADIDRIILHNGLHGDQTAAINTFAISDSTNVRFTAEIISYSGAVQDGLSGGLISIRRSSDSFINFVNIASGALATAGKHTIFLEGTRDVNITINAENAGGRFIMYGGNGEGYVLENSNIKITQIYDNLGIIAHQINGAFDTDVSTGIIIRNNKFFHNVNDNDEIIGVIANVNVFRGVLIQNNSVICAGGNTPIFATVGVGMFGTVFTGNRMGCGTFISDSGIDTEFAGHANFVSNIPE